MNRQEGLARLHRVGGGRDFSDVGMGMVWATAQPSRTRPDIVSTVWLQGDVDLITDQELAFLVDFADAADAWYDRVVGGPKLGCNAIIFEKEHWDGVLRNKWGTRTFWHRRKLQWIQGEMSSPTLGAAMAVFAGQVELVGQWVQTEKSGVGEIVERDYAAPGRGYWMRRDTDKVLIRGDDITAFAPDAERLRWLTMYDQQCLERDYR